MTVASEICRLQTDKECMRQAIIGKGVSVDASVSFDDYAACIAAIPSIPQGRVDLLVVAGGGGGGVDSYTSTGGGGGGGGFIESNYLIKADSYQVKVGAGGYSGNRGCDSCFWNGDFVISACGGGMGNLSGRGIDEWNCGGSGGGGSNGSAYAGGSGIAGQGYDGGKGGWVCGNSYYFPVYGGGGGAGGVGGNGSGIYDCCSAGGNGGIGKKSSITGVERCYSGGGGGSTGARSMPINTKGLGCYGGGNGYCVGGWFASSGFCCGAGGGGGYGGDGANGIIVVRYHTDGSDGILPTSTGGCKYTCGDYTIHCFTNTSSTETFIPVYR